MIPHGEARRRSARVEWVRMDDRASRSEAQAWLAEYGIASTVSVGGTLVAWTPRAVHMTARLGQVLTRNPATGEFAVWDADEFEEQHREIGVVQ